MLTRIPIWLLLCGSLTACGAATKTQYGAGLPTVEASPQEAALESELFGRLNRDREAAGLAPLAYDDRLADIARYHSRDMRDAGFFGHDSPTTGSPQDRIDRAGYLAVESRENVAQAPDANTAQDQLLDSPGHRNNIMATTVTHVGIGVVRDKDVPGVVRGYYFTQLFASPVSEFDVEEARRIIRSKVAGARSGSGQPALAPHPLLQRLAEEHVAAVNVGDPAGGLGAIGDSVMARLQQEPGQGLESVEAAAQVGVSAEMLRPEDLIDSGVRALGFGVAQDRDEAGKPVVKMLLILAR